MKCKRCDGLGYIMLKKAVPTSTSNRFSFMSTLRHDLKDEICPKCYGKGVK